MKHFTLIPFLVFFILCFSSCKKVVNYVDTECEKALKRKGSCTSDPIEINRKLKGTWGFISQYHRIKNPYTDCWPNPTEFITFFTDSFAQFNAYGINDSVYRYKIRPFTCTSKPAFSIDFYNSQNALFHSFSMLHEACDSILVFDQCDCGGVTGTCSATWKKIK